MRGWISLLTLAAALTGCASVFGLEQTTPGMSNWADGAMRRRAAATGCPSEQLTYRYVGRVAGTAWHRHEYSGCDARRRYWTACDSGTCQIVYDALEERAAMDFDCDVEAIEVSGTGNTMRALGCGFSGVYVMAPSGWVLNSREVRQNETASNASVASSQ